MLRFHSVVNDLSGNTFSRLLIIISDKICPSKREEFSIPWGPTTATLENRSICPMGWRVSQWWSTLIVLSVARGRWGKCPSERWAIIKPKREGGRTLTAADAYYADKWLFRPWPCCDDIILRRGTLLWIRCWGGTSWKLLFSWRLVCWGKTPCQKILNYKMVFAYSSGKCNAGFIEMVEKVNKILFNPGPVCRKLWEWII